MDEINFLRKKYFVRPDKMVCEVKDNFTFDEVVKLLREYNEYQASSHKQVVMQAEGSDVSEGAAVASEGDGEANTCAGHWLYIGNGIFKCQHCQIEKNEQDL